MPLLYVSETAAVLELSPIRYSPFLLALSARVAHGRNFWRQFLRLATSLEPDNWLEFASAIMTTDTVAKAVSEQVNIDGEAITVTGVAKGSGMIKPNMATMLAYIACNATVSEEVLQRSVVEIANASFNRITVDGDTSTNDCFMLCASGASALSPIVSVEDPRLLYLEDTIASVAKTLAQSIVRDGEGSDQVRYGDGVWWSFSDRVFGGRLYRRRIASRQDRPVCR